MENMRFSEEIFLHRLLMGNNLVLAGGIIPVLHQLGSAEGPTSTAGDLFLPLRQVPWNGLGLHGHGYNLHSTRCLKLL